MDIPQAQPNVLILAKGEELKGQLMVCCSQWGCFAQAGRWGDADIVQDGRWDLVLIEAVGADAMDLLAVCATHHPERPVILLCPRIDAELRAAARTWGCDQFLALPLAGDALKGMIQLLLPNHPVQMIDSLREHGQWVYQIAGKSRKFVQVVEMARRVAPTSVPVLISGESGTGKELISQLIHRSSNRNRGPFVRVNCAALSDSLLESELFGHEKGAFTGAVAQRKGRFERAHGGTLLLDEISETNPRLQAELLRVLEQQDFERVGGSEVVRVNVRVICTSNRDLAKEVEQGRFRRDLYYRISGVHLVAPPLRDRRDDMEVLVWHFVNLYSREVRRPIRLLDDGMVRLFAVYDWPGNIRQLKNAVRTAMILGQGDVLSLDDAPHLLTELSLGCAVQQGQAPAASTLSLQELERRAILDALQRSQRNQAKAARLLGITDRTLREKLRRYRQEAQVEVGEPAW